MGRWALLRSSYASLASAQRVAELEMDQSFGSTGDCYDNRHRGERRADVPDEALGVVQVRRRLAATHFPRVARDHIASAERR